MGPLSKQPLIVIVGPTASGKTALAVELALEYGGEIICADSRTVYKGMDIGTAKPTPKERKLVPHHLLDIVEPHEVFSAARFKELALKSIDDIRSRGKVPFLVGGTGLYVDSVVFDYKFGALTSKEEREILSHWSIEQLRDYCINNNIELPENDKNKRYLIRAIEQQGVNKQRRQHPLKDIFIVGITTDKITLRDRIVARADQIFTSGALEEASKLARKYGWDHESMTGNIYRLAKRVEDNELSPEQARAEFITADWRLAKRQLTWFRRNPFIQWGDLKEVKTKVRDYLERQ